MRKYDARLIRTAIAAIRLCFEINVLITISSILEILFLSLLLRVVIFRLSNSTYVLTSLSVATGNQQVYTSFSYQHQIELMDATNLTDVIYLGIF